MVSKEAAEFTQAEREVFNSFRMNIKEVLDVINECINDVVFDFNGEVCAVTSVVKNYVPTFTLWYGDKSKNFGNAEDLVNYDFFDGKSLTEIIETVEIRFE